MPPQPITSSQVSSFPLPHLGGIISPIDIKAFKSHPHDQLYKAETNAFIIDNNVRHSRPNMKMSISMHNLPHASGPSSDEVAESNTFNEQIYQVENIQDVNQKAYTSFFSKGQQNSSISSISLAPVTLEAASSKSSLASCSVPSSTVNVNPIDTVVSPNAVVSHQPLLLTRRSLKGNVIDQYIVGNCIGRGSFGAVFRAIDVNTHRTVAIKRIPITNSTQVSTILKEVRQMESLNHENVVKYYGNIQTETDFNIILEYVENGSLASTLKHFGNLPERFVGTITLKVLHGLAYLHDRGLKHLDLKAANILTTKDGSVKVSDFGVSQSVMDTSSDKFVGSAYWMAPEVIILDGTHTASDVWSLGCTIIELLTGSPPYFDLLAMSALYKIVEVGCPSFPEGITPGLKDFLTKCFMHDYKLRPTVNQLLEHEWILRFTSTSTAAAPKANPVPPDSKDATIDTTHANQHLAPKITVKRPAPLPPSFDLLPCPEEPVGNEQTLAVVSKSTSVLSQIGPIVNPRLLARIPPPNSRPISQISLKHAYSAQHCQVVKPNMLNIPGIILNNQNTHINNPTSASSPCLSNSAYPNSLSDVENQNFTNISANNIRCKQSVGNVTYSELGLESNQPRLESAFFHPIPLQKRFEHKWVKSTFASVVRCSNCRQSIRKGRVCQECSLAVCKPCANGDNGRQTKICNNDLNRTSPFVASSNAESINDLAQHKQHFNVGSETSETAKMLVTYGSPISDPGAYCRHSKNNLHDHGMSPLDDTRPTSSYSHQTTIPSPDHSGHPPSASGTNYVVSPYATRSKAREDCVIM